MDFDTGRRLTSEDFRGKVVLLNFWATWCVPCREEMPALDRLQAKFGAKDFEVVAVSIDKADKGPAALKVFYREVGIRHLRIYHDPTGDAGFDVGMVGIPTTLLLDREGRELGSPETPACSAPSRPAASGLCGRGFDPDGYCHADRAPLVIRDMVASSLPDVGVRGLTSAADESNDDEKTAGPCWS